MEFATDNPAMRRNISQELRFSLSIVLANWGGRRMTKHGYKIGIRKPDGHTHTLEENSLNLRIISA
jgi:hypothetical protein